MLYLQYNGSACTETPDTAGLHHLWEHILCQTWKPHQGLFTRNCIEWNAFTKSHCVNFYFRGLSDCVQEILETAVLAPGGCDITRTVPSRAEFEIERKVVLQEYESAHSERWESLCNNILRRHFRHYGPIGRKEVLQDLTYMDFLKAFDTWLPKAPSAVTFVRGSDYRPTHPVMKTVTDIQYRMPEIRASAKPIAELGDFKPDYSCGSAKETIIADTMIIPEGSVPPKMLGFIEALWDDGFDSPFFMEFRHRTGLAYSTGLIGSPVFPMLCTYITVAPGDVKKARKLLKSMTRNWEAHITRERFNNIKKMLLNMITGIETNTCTHAYVQRLNSGFAISRTELAAITFDQISGYLQAMSTLPWHEASLGSEMIIA